MQLIQKDMGVNPVGETEKLTNIDATMRKLADLLSENLKASNIPRRSNYNQNWNNATNTDQSRNQRGRQEQRYPQEHAGCHPGKG